MSSEQIPVTAAALRLGVDYQQCRRLILTGRLSGGRDAFGRLYAESAAVEALRGQYETRRTSARQQRRIKVRRVR